jgi:hypothetical protein
MVYLKILNDLYNLIFIKNHQNMILDLFYYPQIELVYYFNPESLKLIL